MDYLPQEIHNEIGALFVDLSESWRPVSRSDLAARRHTLATISRPWQEAIERQTFRQLRLRSTNLGSFEQIVRGSRRRYLGTILYTIVLPEYDIDVRSRFESELDRWVNDEAFTKAFSDLFQILKAWDEEIAGKEHPYSIELEIENIYSPSDDKNLRAEALVPRLSPRLEAAEPDGEERSHYHDLQDRHFQYSYLHLLRPAELPMVTSLVSLTTRATKRLLSPRAAVDITAKLPNVRKGNCLVSDTERRYPALRRCLRHDFAQVIRDVLPNATALQALEICLHQELLWNHAWNPADLTSTSTGSDPVGSAMREATCGLKYLTDLAISGCLDHSLLWPGPGSPLPQPFWQNMERLDIQFDMTTPSGSWYFRARTPAEHIDVPASIGPDTLLPPGYGHSEEEDAMAALQYSESENQRRSGGSMCLFRWVPDEGTIVPLIEAFGRACAQIPSLRISSLTTTIQVPLQIHQLRSVPVRSPWGVSYAAPGAEFSRKWQLDPAFRENVQQRRIMWDVKDWLPSNHLRGIIGSIGQCRYGDELVEKHVDFWAAVMRPRELARFRCSYW
ncbi:hypothetical protein FALBO_1236 [Fusarium albosuccineum]|uniref:F-box domain-containing protein n=1 Tax=Fusarium albosuccineum TaxID=1237068 RepID=A0A8H4PGG8_9HYPO|nr:hypothetical protein FALBO_1236 [Fusarium albosuccineum]